MLGLARIGLERRFVRPPVLIAALAAALLPAMPASAQAPSPARKSVSAKPTAPANPSPTAKSKALRGEPPDGRSEQREDDRPGLRCAAADADRALSQAVTAAFEPAPEEIRVIAVEDLGFLGDPRALNLLAELMLDPSPAVRSAAVRAVRAFALPRAEEILEDVVRLGRFDEALELQALDALLFQRSPTALAFLESVRDDPDHRFGPKLADAARSLAARWSPPSQH